MIKYCLCWKYFRSNNIVTVLLNKDQLIALCLQFKKIESYWEVNISVIYLYILGIRYCYGADIEYFLRSIHESFLTQESTFCWWEEFLGNGSSMRSLDYLKSAFCYSLF